jgi:hypothetical protein
MKVTIREIQEAYGAFERVLKEKLPAKAAWRCSRLLVKVKSELRKFEEFQRDLYLKAGGISQGAQVLIQRPAKKKDETDEAFAERVTAYMKTSHELTTTIKALLDEEISIDYEPIPLALFALEGIKLAPFDLAELGPFICSDGDEPEARDREAA